MEMTDPKNKELFDLFRKAGCDIIFCSDSLGKEWWQSTVTQANADMLIWLLKLKLKEESNNG